MSTFTLAISCLATSYLPWFMDLTFQVLMQYCSLQHQTLLLSPVTSTIGYCFCFGSIPSFFLELFLHWSPVGYWAPTDLGSSSFSILSFCLSYCSWGFQSKNADIDIEVAQLCPTFCNPMDSSLPGSSIHGIFQARVLEWVAISFSRRSSQHRDWTRVFRIVGRHFTVWATVVCYSLFQWTTSCLNSLAPGK